MRNVMIAILFVFTVVVGPLAVLASYGAISVFSTDKEEDGPPITVGMGMTSNEEARLTQAEMNIQNLQDEVTTLHNVLIKMHVQLKANEGVTK